MRGLALLPLRRAFDLSRAKREINNQIKSSLDGSKHILDVLSGA